jgi:ATP-dependent exoDNAse (exonuclease V) beta subunit
MRPSRRNSTIIFETERRLIYVACTRAREHLLLTGVPPTSEYLADFTS